MHTSGSRSTSATLASPPPARRLVGVLLALCLAAAACGGGAADTAGEASPTPSPDTAAEPTGTPGQATGAGEEATTVRIAFVPATTGLMLNVAQQEGFFAEQGIKAELTPATNISEMIPALGRQVDISLGTSTDLIRAAASGLDVVQISGNTIDTEDNPFVQLIVRPDSGIEDITDLAGKRVASPTLSGVIHMATLYWAQQEGVDTSTIQGVQVPPPNLPDQLTSGQVDAVEALEPFASRLLAGGNISLGDPFAAIGRPLATNFWMANGQWAADNPEVVGAFRTALEQALEFVQENEDAARDVLQEFTGMPPPVAQNAPLPTFDLEIRTQDLRTWIDVLVALGEEEVADVAPQDLVFQPAG